MNNAFHLNEHTGRYFPLRPLTPRDIIDQAKSLVSKQMLLSTEPLTSPSETKEFLQLHMSELEHETFSVFFLDNRHRVITYKRMFRGTIDNANVYPREVVKAALQHNAAALIFAHNHPSGDPEPSNTDIELTQKLKKTLDLVDVRVLDHMVISSETIVSFAEKGIL